MLRFQRFETVFFSILGQPYNSMPDTVVATITGLDV